MDTSDPEIGFDAEGRCNHCTTQLAKLERLKREGRYGCEHFHAVIDGIRPAGRGRRYDGVLGISGGLDSCFLALSLKQTGLRLLLVHVDNGWDSASAAANIKATAEALDYDYESYVLDWEEFREIQLAFLRASVVEAETPTDVAISGAIHRVATAHGIRFIVSASNEASEGILPRLWHYDAKDMRYFSAINRRYGRGQARNFPAFGFLREAQHKLIRRTRMVYPLNFMDYDRARAVRTVKEEIGWRDYGGKHHESHYTRFVQSYLLPKKFGLDYRKATLSSLLCVGQVTRADALAVLERPPYDPEDVERQKTYVALKLGLSRTELEELIERPGRYFYEFPNNARRLAFSYGLYNRLRRARGRGGSSASPA